MLTVLGTVALTSCDDGAPAKGDNKVFFVGYLYDGATGMRLPKTAITSVSIEYRATKITAKIEDDGRFISDDPLPTWQDFAVTVVAEGYRAFTSHNLGIDVPASLAMTNGVASATTTQTFAVDAYLFPVALKAPKMTLTIATVDDMTGLPVLNKAMGTLRLRPQSQSTVQVGAADSAVGTPRVSRRVWVNDEDLLTQTLIKPIVAGNVMIAEGEMVYGVAYEISVYDVAAYQPLVVSGAQGLVAGTTTSRTLTLTRDLRDPLKLIANTATMCTPPAGAATTFGASIALTFSEKIELVGTTVAEDVDSGLSVIAPQAIYPTPQYCQLKNGFDPTMQERGSKVEIADTVLTFSFNPSIGFATTNQGTICSPPPAITSVTYNVSTIILQPVGDPTRKRSLSAMLQEMSQGATSTSLSCPMRAGF